MSRELKFRAWANGYEKWCEFIDTTAGVWLGTVNTTKRNYTTTDVTVEQYTGLKDKNGKEIYEGDIVRHGETMLEIKFDEIKDSDFTYYYLGWIMECDTCTDSLCEYNNAVEVIGNIHEKPELLGGKE